MSGDPKKVAAVCISCQRKRRASKCEISKEIMSPIPIRFWDGALGIVNLAVKGNGIEKYPPESGKTASLWSHTQLG